MKLNMRLKTGENLFHIKMAELVTHLNKKLFNRG